MSGVTVEVCLRSAVTGVVEARQDEVLDRVQQLERGGHVDGVDITYWSGQVTAPYDGARNDSGVPDVVTELYDVTGDSERSLEPFFREATVDGGHRTTLFLPVVCIVVRRGEDIVGVYPSTGEDGHESIQDGLGKLGDDGETENVA